MRKTVSKTTRHATQTLARSTTGQAGRALAPNTSGEPAQVLARNMTRRAPRAPTRESTREQLLEMAGQVFAEKGFEAATGKEICERAGANAAAVVYHFGGMEGLYGEVLREARNRLVSDELLSRAVTREKDPRAKLEAFIRLLIGALAGPASQSWAPRVLSREMLSPQGYGRQADELAQGRARIAKSIVSELTGLPIDHPVVARATVSIMAPCGMLLIANRLRLERALPGFNIRPDTVEDITRHMTEFALAGLAAVSRGAQK